MEACRHAGSRSRCSWCSGRSGWSGAADDPEEVDRHLEQVSRWFVSTEPGEALSHERAALAEQERDWRAARPSSRAGCRARGSRPTPRSRAPAAARTPTRSRPRRRGRRPCGGGGDPVRRPARGGGRRGLTAARHEAAEIRAALDAEVAREREERLAAVRAEAAELATRLRGEAESEAEAYAARRRREADRLVEAARRERGYGS